MSWAEETSQSVPGAMAHRFTAKWNESDPLPIAITEAIDKLQSRQIAIGYDKDNKDKAKIERKSNSKHSKSEMNPILTQQGFYFNSCPLVCFNFNYTCSLLHVIIAKKAQKKVKKLIQTIQTIQNTKTSWQAHPVARFKFVLRIGKTYHGVDLMKTK